MTDIDKLKKETRRKIKSIIADMPKTDFFEYGKSICEEIMKNPLYKSAKSVFCFVSMNTEADTMPLLEDIISSEKTLYLPKITEGGKMILVKTKQLEFNTGKYGIREPIGDAEDNYKIDLAIIPCLAMSKRGERLGRGGGYYDRFLADFTGNVIAVCPQRLVFDTLPAEAHDIKIKYTATEKGIIKTDGE